MQYQPHIDGLRAVAVLAVLFFHAKLPGFSGGYVGVDVFFVISGYLITSIIHGAFQRGDFNLSGFFASRVRRIIPAYAFVVLTIALASVVFQLPREMIDTGQSLLAAAVFATNILFWLETNYFAGAAELKPLLHTWSLSVEAQFYLLFPVFLLLLHQLKCRISGVLACLFALSCLSLAAAEVWLQVDPKGAFFLLPFRVWEFTIGSMLALLPLKRPTDARVAGLLSLAGLSLIAASVVLYDSKTTFPGISALLPCFGAALVIFSGTPRWGPAQVITTGASTFIGRISYSLYLWHWPVLALGRYVKTDNLDRMEALVALGASFVLSVLSYYLIEQPFRDRKRLPIKRAYAFAGVASTLMGLAGATFVLGEGLPQRLPSDIASVLEVQKRSRPECMAGPHQWIGPERGCVYGDVRHSVSAVLWGDSHAHAMADGLGEMFSRNAVGMRLVGYTACPPVPLLIRVGGGAGDRCSEHVEAARRYILSDDTISVVILAARHPVYVEGETGNWGPAEGHGGPKIAPVEDGRVPGAPLATAYAARLAMLIAELQRAGKVVVLIKSIPEVGFDVPTTVALRRRFALGNGADFERPRTMYDIRTASLAAGFKSAGSLSNTILIEPVLDLCDASFCETVRDGKLLYYDDDHLSIHGARIVAERVERALLSAGAMKPGT